MEYVNDMVFDVEFDGLIVLVNIGCIIVFVVICYGVIEENGVLYEYLVL